MQDEASVPVAGEIIGYCGKCKMDLNHRVIAKDGPKVLKAQCLTCSAEHRYRRPKESGVVRSATPGRARSAATPKRKKMATSATNPSAAWEEAISGVPPEGFRPYRMFDSYGPGDFVSHSKFGKGAVTRVVAPGRMEVLFKEGARALVFDRPPKK